MQNHTSNTISGSVHRVISKSADSGWAAIEVDSNGQAMMVVGSLAHIDEGLRIEADGAWTKHQHFGWQFKVSSARVFPPTSIDGIERFLRSGAVEGIGPVFAKKIVSTFGEETLRVIESDQWRLKRLKGVGPKRVKAVVDGVKEYRDRMEVMSFLHGKLGPKRAQRVYEKYGSGARSIIANNPYRLIDDFDGIGFKIADEVARDVAVGLDDPMRLRAAVLTVLKSAVLQGHTCLAVETCGKLAGELLGSVERGEKAIAVPPREDSWVSLTKDGVVYFELTKYRFLEERVATLIADLIGGTCSVPSIDPALAIPWAEAKIGIELEQSQKDAVSLALSAKACCITGGPGVGKTTILNSILMILNAKKVRVSLAAPTGRAARRMTESTGGHAETIHKLLEYSPAKGGFTRNKDNPLDCQAIFIDESSMVDISLARSLLEAVPKTARIVFVGDNDQLPSVGPGQVLADLIASGCVPTARLTEIFRQVSDSPIIRNAHMVNAGLVPELGISAEFEFIETEKGAETAAAVIETICNRLPREGFDAKRDVTCLSPMHRGAVGVENLNVELQSRLNGSPTACIERNGRRYGVGDKVLQLRNNRNLVVFNGDIGIITRIDEQAKTLQILFDQSRVDYPFSELSSLGLAYCTTVHKAQGSQADVVVIAVDMSSTVLLDRKLLYTAITRAKKKVVLIGQKRAIHIAVSESRAHMRQTTLRDRIVSATAAPKLSGDKTAIH